jgi:hypothetical protein
VSADALPDKGGKGARGESVRSAASRQNRVERGLEGGWGWVGQDQRLGSQDVSELGTPLTRSLQRGGRGHPWSCTRNFIATLQAHPLRYPP